MGYMGFGMNKDVYTRKARKPSSRLRDLFRSETKSKISESTSLKKDISSEEMEQIKREIRKKAKKQRIINIFWMLITISILYFLFWYFIE